MNFKSSLWRLYFCFFFILRGFWCLAYQNYLTSSVTLALVMCIQQRWRVNEHHNKKNKLSALYDKKRGICLLGIFWAKSLTWKNRRGFICHTWALVVLLPMSPLARWAAGAGRSDWLAGAGQSVTTLAAESRGGCGRRGEAATHQSWNETWRGVKRLLQ